MNFKQTNMNKGSVNNNVFGKNIDIAIEDEVSEEIHGQAEKIMHQYCCQMVAVGERVFTKGVIVGVAITALVIAAAFGCFALWGLVL